MSQTTNYGLEKPLSTDYYDVEVQNRNMDKLDAALAGVDAGKIAAAKETPADADSLVLSDSADGGKGKKLLWSRVKAALKGYMDDLYAKAAHGHKWGDISEKPGNFTPAAHAASHGKSGADKITPAAIGAAALQGPVTVSVPLSWSGTGPWTQTLTVAGVTAADNHLGVFPAPVADAAARKLQYEAYGCLSPADCETVAGGIVSVCNDKCPEVAFQVVVKGVR